VSANPVSVYSLFPGLPPAEVEAHQVLTRMREQQAESGFHSPVAVGVFIAEGQSRQVVATVDGISFLPHGSGIPANTWLLSEIVDAEFYQRWRGYDSPAWKLVAAAREAGPQIGSLNVVVSSHENHSFPGANVFVQTEPQRTKLVDARLQAPTVRSRAKVARCGAATDEQIAWIEETARTTGLGAVDLADASTALIAARWSDSEEGWAGYQTPWLRYLLCEGMHAIERGDRAEVGYITNELSLLFQPAR